MTPVWLSLHLFYSENLDAFLATTLKTYTDTIIKTGAAQRFFFIRYRERGPHIRLRIQGDDFVIEHIIRENALEHFNNYFKMYPSKRFDPNQHPDTPADQLWLPNNTVQVIEYLPETERYGGELGLRFSENHFFISSKVVLEAMNINAWNEQQAIGIAMRLHLGMVSSLGMDLDEAADFFAAIYAHWLPVAIARERITQAQFEQQQHLINENHEQGFIDQKDDLVSFIAALWEAFDAGNEFEEDYFNEWLLHCKRLGQEFKLAQAQGQLAARPKEFLMKISTTTDNSRAELWQFYADFVHLTNNRLGIGNEDESYMAYLIMRSLEELL
jgi:thiopeptide-type bacteriocin biosynthesis protein